MHPSVPALETRLPFGEWLKRRRKTLDLTREKLAWRVGCSFETIKKIESGDLKPSAQLAELLATKLDVPPSERDAFIRFARTDATMDAFAFSGLPLAVAAPPAPPRTQNLLPAPVTSLLGRGRELHVARGFLERQDVRLLTLSGPPGAGKTRLALALATQLRDAFADGAVFVPLALVQDPALVMPAIANVFQVQELGNEPLSSALLKTLQAKHALVVLDNFEQIIAAAPVVSELLTAAPALKIIVTSREALRVYGEQEFPVPPLELPDVKHLPPVEALAHYSAVALFVARARAVKPDFELTPSNAPHVARICALLDGLPLALEMAAVQIKRAPPARLQAQLQEKLVALGGGLRDLSPRQQTLRGALDWSYNLLTADEQRVLARLSVFVGGADLTALRYVLADTDDTDPPLEETLASLVDKNLAQALDDAVGARYAMLETIRGYAREKLQSGGAFQSVLARHAQYFAAFAEQESSVAADAEVAQHEFLEREHENLRAALTWTLEQSDARPALGLCRALGAFWKLRGHWSEGLLWTRRALTLSAPAEPGYQTLRADALFLAAQLAERQESADAPRAMYMESLQLRRALGDERAIIESLDALALFCFMHGEHDTARAYAHQALPLARAYDDPRITARILNLLGRLELVRVEHAAARVYLQESLVLSRAAADTTNTAGALYHMGNAAHVEGRYEDARRDLLEALQLYRARGDIGSARRVLVSLGMTAVGMDDFVSAKQWLDESLDLAHTLNDRYGEAFSLHSLGMVSFWQGDLPEARRLLETALEAARSIGANTGAGRLARTSLGLVELAEGNADAAYTTGTEMLAAWRAVHDREDEGRALGILGYVALMRGDLETAQQHFADRLALARALAKFPRLAEALFDCGYMAFKRKEMANAQTFFAELLQTAHHNRSKSWRGLALSGLALLAQPIDAARATFLFRASAALLETIPLNRGSLPALVRQDIMHAEARARGDLDAETLSRVWAEAGERTWEQVYEYALTNVLANLP